MNVSLPAEAMDFVEAEVATGRYGSASEVVQDALRLLAHAHADEAAARLKDEISNGLRQAQAGRFSDREVGEIAASVIGREPRP